MPDNLKSRIASRGAQMGATRGGMLGTGSKPDKVYEKVEVVTKQLTPIVIPNRSRRKTMR